MPQLLSLCSRAHRPQLLSLYATTTQVHMPESLCSTRESLHAATKTQFRHLKKLLPFSHSVSHVRLFMNPWTTAQEASLSFTISWSLLKLSSIESVTPSNYLILCRPLHLQPSVFPSIRVFSNESVLRIRCPKYY